jgi:hypothetical protein
MYIYNFYHKFWNMKRSMSKWINMYTKFSINKINSRNLDIYIFKFSTLLPGNIVCDIINAKIMHLYLKYFVTMWCMLLSWTGNLCITEDHYVISRSEKLCDNSMQIYLNFMPVCLCLTGTFREISIKFSSSSKEYVVISLNFFDF